MNRPNTYQIDYEVFDIDNISLKKGQIKVKNKFSEFEAKCSLEGYLKKKYHNFHRLVIYKCETIYHTFLGDMTGFDRMFDFLNPNK